MLYLKGTEWCVQCVHWPDDVKGKTINFKHNRRLYVIHTLLRFQNTNKEDFQLKNCKNSLLSQYQSPCFIGHKKSIIIIDFLWPIKIMIFDNRKGVWWYICWMTSTISRPCGCLVTTWNFPLLHTWHPTWLTFTIKYLLYPFLMTGKTFIESLLWTGKVHKRHAGVE